MNSLSTGDSPHNLVFIGGVAGSGKTSTTTALVNLLGAIPARFHESFFRVAEAIGVPRTQAFTSPQVDELSVWEDYAEQIRANPVTVSEIHYAIQPARDSAAALGSDARDILWPDEDYVLSFPAEMLRFLAGKNIKMLLVLLRATPETALMRLIARDGPSARTQSVQSMAKEIAAEEYCFAELASGEGVRSLRIDTEITLPPDSARIVADHIQKNYL